ncbi:MAG TPA: thiamine phosphate synthase [Gemmatimonadales bacterium]
MTPRAGAERSALLRLIVIIDHDAARGRDCAALAAAAERGGATMLQVRAKQLGPGQIAGLTRQIIAAVSLPVIVNDRFDVAIATGAAGCHLGPADLPLDVARRLAPAGFILGGSAGNPEEARIATRGGADYLGVGPIHSTANKSDAGGAIGIEGFTAVRLATALPCVAIGGVGASDIPALVEAGAAGIAVIGAALNADDVEEAVRRLNYLPP